MTVPDPNPDPQPMPALARERLVVQLEASGMNGREITGAAILAAERAGFTKRGLGNTSVLRILDTYRERVQAETADELRDSWQRQCDRLYLDLGEYRRRFVEAAVADDEPRMGAMHTRIMTIERELARLEGNYQDSEVDLDVATIHGYMRSIGFDDAEVSEVADLAQQIVASKQRGAFTVIEGGAAEA